MGLTVGKIFSGVITAIRQRPGSLLGMWAAYAALFVAAIVGLGLAVGIGGIAGLASGGESGAGLMALGAGVVIAMIAFYVLYLALMMAQYGALCALASPLQSPSFGEAFATGWRSVPTLLGATLLLALVYIIVLSIVTAIGGEGSAISGILSLVVFVAIIYFACRLIVMVPLVAVEGKRGPINIIRQSWDMTRGNALPIFLSVLVFGVLLIVMALVLILPFAGGLGGMMMGGEGPAFASLALFFVGICVFAALATMVQAALGAVVHAELNGSTGVNVEETFG
ncbi:glycerophosphoryl diester phosphodiesterase membrane domain-containing protein [Altererythrobacter sp. KTW20L]|uniref:glycerophosphoryl diester phosphodiesterase membrane domain-containing protein n=1 Tax=Altererythrobacter sp. KTW20L TaxID=2942210 RepID=UPI0020BF1DFB|nr:glycerophosphoryl diester phosphodiesterase membrane domain-containing protein [Altererythrobacter sp. KTW20L]MCL6249716.1 glycerophosphoryl diester phosphodiesterase membrane domain-containing protein [Altererythrobacter sp. KTW20L]